MPALTIDKSKLGLHIFGTGNTDKKKLSGFHSKAKIAECALPPKPKRTFTVGTHGFYLCGWNYKPSSDQPLKWSTMFPDSWDDKKVIAAITAAVDYWNLPPHSEERTRLDALAASYKVAWVGNAKVDGYTYIIGGMTNSGSVISGFPLLGANANVPRPNFAVSLDDVEDEG